VNGKLDLFCLKKKKKAITQTKKMVVENSLRALLLDSNFNLRECFSSKAWTKWKIQMKKIF